jgi:hypothetical protein
MALAGYRFLAKALAAMQLERDSSETANAVDRRTRADTTK